MSPDTIEIAASPRRDLASRVSRRLASLVPTRIARLANPRPMVSFTFDDIPDSAASNGARILEANGVRGTFYVASGLCGNRYGAWRFVTGPTVAALRDAGHEIGCHTHGHPDVQTLSPDAIRDELRRNGEGLAALDPGLVPRNFAYPYGSVGLPQKRVVAPAFRSCRGVRAGLNAGLADLGQLKARRLYDVELSRAGVDALLAETVRRRAWLVFYTHDVADPSTDQGCSTGLFAHAVEAALRMGCDVLTIDAALDAAGVP
ncbi:MAG TPA: polysaccharide deacetylase family protein [Salinarimonas sp.]|nr:polysaccharide deacetylase family protein [Salinarimonas sp.]